MNKGQLLIEVVLGLGLLVIILGIILSFLGLMSRSQKYSHFNQAIAISGFEKYRNVLISLSQTNWQYLDSLLENTDYYIYPSGTQWLISPGKEIITSQNEKYFFSFQIQNYGTNTIKFVTTSAQYLDLVFQDYFLLPKLNVNY